MSELYHHGIQGQKWGVRRFQNPDGTLTSRGKKRYGADKLSSISTKKGIKRRLNDIAQDEAKFTRISQESQYMSNRYKSQGNKVMAKEYAEEVAQAKKYISDGQREISKLKKVGKLNGLSITDKDTKYYAANGNEKVAQYVSSAVGQATLGVIGNVTLGVVTNAAITANAYRKGSSIVQPGKRYKVKDIQ